MPTLIIHGDDDQIVPIDASARRSAALSKAATPEGVPRRLPRPRAVAPTKNQFNTDLLAFLRG